MPFFYAFIHQKKKKIPQIISLVEILEMNISEGIDFFKLVKNYRGKKDALEPTTVVVSMIENRIHKCMQSLKLNIDE